MTRAGEAARGAEAAAPSHGRYDVARSGGQSGRESRFLTPFAEDASGFGMTGACEATRGVEAAAPSQGRRYLARSGRQSGGEKQVPHAVREKRERVRSRECIRDAKGANDRRGRGRAVRKQRVPHTADSTWRCSGGQSGREKQVPHTADTTWRVREDRAGENRRSLRRFAPRRESLHDDSCARGAGVLFVFRSCGVIPNPARHYRDGVRDLLLGLVVGLRRLVDRTCSEDARPSLATWDCGLQ